MFIFILKPHCYAGFYCLSHAFFFCFRPPGVARWNYWPNLGGSSEGQTDTGLVRSQPHLLPIAPLILCHTVLGLAPLLANITRNREVEALVCKWTGIMARNSTWLWKHPGAWRKQIVRAQMSTTTDGDRIRSYCRLVRYMKYLNKYLLPCRQTSSTISKGCLCRLHMFGQHRNILRLSGLDYNGQVKKRVVIYNTQTLKTHTNT
jgi:hypothetical protein